MEPSITVETPRDSMVLAYGTAPTFGQRRGIILGIITALTVLFGLFLLWVSLSRPLAIGTRTLVIITQPSKARNVLSANIRTSLPLSWQQALKSSSIWPVLLGGGLGPNGWEWFAVLPRWQTAGNLPTATAGLSRILYDQAPVSAHQSIQYSEALSALLRTPRQEARGTFALDAVSASSTPLSFEYRQGVVSTSLHFEHHVRNFQPRAADLSIDLSSLADITRTELLRSLPIPGFALLDSLQEVHLHFRDQGMPDMVQLVDSNPLTRAQTAQILAGFGITTKRLIQLADGSTATELTSPTGDMTQAAQIDNQTSILIQDREIRYGSSTDALPFVAPACGDRSIIGRMSATSLQKLVQSVGLVFEPSALSGWQIGEAKDGAMVLCSEK